jgi:hypothetical protein
VLLQSEPSLLDLNPEALEAEMKRRQDRARQFQEKRRAAEVRM